MIYIRNIFKQDLRDGKQIAFPKEASNVFFKFDYSLPDPERMISFKFEVQDPKSPFVSKSGQIITTRLYASGSESRIDGELKQFLRDELDANIDDIIVFKYKTENSFEFDFISKSSPQHGKYKDILKNSNHEVVINDISETHNSDENTSSHFENLKEDFADWFIKLDGSKHNYFKDSFSSNRIKLIEALSEYEDIYNEEFNSLVFRLSTDNVKEYLNTLESNLYQESGNFYEFSKKKSTHMPRAILGKNNYIKYLKDKIVNDQGLVRIKSLGPQKDFGISDFQNACKNTGLVYTEKLITRFVSSLLTKPFLILTGLSGSGKTKLAQAFVQWICQEESQYRIIPVEADWTNREPLLGYPNALNPDEYVKPDSGVIDLIIQANSNPDLPHFMILDEMNLSHVERYFADFLSAIESKEEITLHSGDEGAFWNGVPPSIKIPGNLFIIGTVNIDETTYMFSPKVLDRANVIEFRVSQDELAAFLENPADVDLSKIKVKGSGMAEDFVRIANSDASTYSQKDVLSVELLKFFSELNSVGAEFGYRSAFEINRFASLAEQLAENWKFDQIMDAAIVQKLLPKLHGSRKKLEKVLFKLGDLCHPTTDKSCEELFKKHEHLNSEIIVKAKYPISFEKIVRMHKGLVENGFTSFAEA